MADKVIDLRSLQNEIAGKIELNDGVHEVRRLNVGQYQAAMRINLEQITDPATALELSIDIASEVVPTLSREQVAQLAPAVLTAIVAFASQGIDAVERLFPNVRSPEPPTSPG
jgi:tRNA U55 pseudouridine synthase TruB